MLKISIGITAFLIIILLFTSCPQPSQHTQHTDINPKDHKCDECPEIISDCIDISPKDHDCDICGDTLSVCSDINPKNHYCDVCLIKMSEHIDENMDNACDYCGETGEHIHSDISPKDHKCDSCGVTMNDGGHTFTGNVPTCDLQDCNELNPNYIEPLEEVPFTKYTNQDQNWAQLGIRLGMQELRKQSENINTRYDNWASELTSGTAEHDFVVAVQTAQLNIQAAYNSHTNGSGNNAAIDNIKGVVADQIGIIINEMKPFIVNQQLFDLQMQVFRRATTGAYRTRMSPLVTNDLTLGLENLTNDIEALMGDTSLFGGVDFSKYSEKAKELLINSIPQSLRPYGLDILQQIEDYSEFNGISNDIFDRFPTVVASADVQQGKKSTFTIIMTEQEAVIAKTREEMQNEQGLYV